jgi:hypothetical protein
VGFFAVASASGAEAKPSIERCHLNVWTLGGLFGYRVCCFDVGLKVRAGERPLKSLRVGLPFSTPESSNRALESLKGRMEDPTVAGLIFAREEASARSGFVALREGEVPLLDIDRPHCEMAERPRAKHFSLWTLALTDELAAGEAGYMRVRFHIQSPGRLWLWQRSLLAKNRAIVDCRVSDEREAQSVEDTSEFTHHLLPLGSLNAFVIAPAAFAPSVITPEPNYVRALEGTSWEDYLGRKTDIPRNEKFLIYHWRKDEETTAVAPFRAFLQLERRRSLLPSWSDLMPVLLALALAIALLDVDFRDGIGDLLGSVVDFVFSGYNIAYGLGGVIALLLFFFALWDRLRLFTSRLRGGGARIDRLVYSMRMDDG